MKNLTTEKQACIMNCSPDEATEFCSNILKTIDELQPIYVGENAIELIDLHNRISVIRRSITIYNFCSENNRTEVLKIGAYIMKMAVVITYDYSLN